MNNRLKILCFLLAFVYIFMIGYAVGEQVYNIANRAESPSVEKNDTITEHYHRVMVSLKPKAVNDSISKSVINELTGKPINIEIIKSKASLLVDISSYSIGTWIAVVIQAFVMLTILFIVVYIPIQTFKIIKSVIRNHIFDSKVIKRIRRIGYFTLFLFFGSNYYFWIEEMIVKKYISMQEYDIADYDRKYLYLFFGIVILIFAEVLSISQKIKEEQDLTI